MRRGRKGAWQCIGVLALLLALLWAPPSSAGNPFEHRLPAERGKTRTWCSLYAFPPPLSEPDLITTSEGEPLVGRSAEPGDWVWDWAPNAYWEGTAYRFKLGHAVAWLFQPDIYTRLFINRSSERLIVSDYACAEASHG